MRPLNAQAAVAAAAVNSPDRAIPETNSWASPESPIGTQKNTRQLALAGESPEALVYHKRRQTTLSLGLCV